MHIGAYAGHDHMQNELERRHLVSACFFKHYTSINLSFPVFAKNHVLYPTCHV